MRARIISFGHFFDEKHLYLQSEAKSSGRMSLGDACTASSASFDPSQKNDEGEKQDGEVEEDEEEEEEDLLLTFEQMEAAVSVFEHNYGKSEGFQGFKDLVPGLHIVDGMCELLPEFLEQYTAFQKGLDNKEVDEEEKKSEAEDEVKEKVKNISRKELVAAASKGKLSKYGVNGKSTNVAIIHALRQRDAEADTNEE